MFLLIFISIITCIFTLMACSFIVSAFEADKVRNRYGYELEMLAHRNRCEAQYQIDLDRRSRGGL